VSGLEKFKTSAGLNSAVSWRLSNMLERVVVAHLPVRNIV
jgi:hypothetical protein